MKRDLDKDFLNAMREKLESGRQSGYVGWDREWVNCTFPMKDVGGPTGYFVSRLQQEVAELIVALTTGDHEVIRKEAADVANFAMFLSDYNK